jgi:hypothetical protein
MFAFLLKLLLGACFRRLLRQQDSALGLHVLD